MLTNNQFFFFKWKKLLFEYLVVCYCRFSYAGNWELVKSVVGQNLEKAMFVYILQREIGYDS